MPVRRSKRFNRAFRKLPPHVQAKVLKALRLLDADFRHPSLRARRVQGTPDIYEARVDHKHRMTYQRRGDVLLMRNVGAHNDVLGKP
jgi:mRNA-degrading endonuclease YafQ of YafQ-DinJ toxin-antitoxin module